MQKISLLGLYRLVQLKTGDATYFDPNAIPDPEERLYTLQLLLTIGQALRSEEDIYRLERMLTELVSNQSKISALEALERLAMIL
jgi:hypothetical protein